ncbi:UDP-glucose 4-epimerase GalE [Consotaella salsifontis]|uniref:UDP-glucose 4-epimerase n=1 Tax=Consotaella salsifontis TaxID=1365950 RepID=A0A1T4SMN3_9HYPH|nr:UDP-glucose 4-epimerase GalE [Consotaella salsifontis]SKA29489.1 UDP-galactose 4-epimerase [Consotaella salsifontis]
MSESVLVCGGAGYIGSHMTRLLAEEGFDVTVFDNLSSGHREAVRGARLVVGDVNDRAALDDLFRSKRFTAVFHFAALISVSDSVSDPASYYRNNVVGTLNLLDAMRAAGVERFVFSSTAATYGNPEYTPIDEDHPHRPLNSYGRTKKMVEEVLADYAVAYGLKSVCFRYFNAAGAHPDGTMGEAHDPETHLVPNVLRAIAGEIPALQIFGRDYPTPDGTCVRDYIHILDLCSAHLAALGWMGREGGASIFNLGNGAGFSILEVMAAAEKVTGRPVPHSFAPRRAGDAAVLVADSSKARQALGWTPRFADLSTIVETAWRWQTNRAY